MHWVAILRGFALSELLGLVLLAPVLTLGRREVLLRDRLSGPGFSKRGKDPDSLDSELVVMNCVAFCVEAPPALIAPSGLYKLDILDTRGGTWFHDKPEF